LAHPSRRKQEHAMAKSKSTKPAKSKSTKPLKSPVEKPEVDRVSVPDPAAARTPGIFSYIEIGHIAGEVWGLLSRDGGQTVAAIKKSIHAPSDVVLAAIGWLAREDKLEFSAHGRAVKLSLR
jgi:Winged helix-turn-helix domain (DUF2582)